MNEDALNIAQLAENLRYGYYAHQAVLSIAADQNAEILMPPVISGQLVPIEIVRCKDGTKHEFDFEHHLRLSTMDSFVKTELSRTWLTGALLNLGDALARYSYFDRSPLLELVRHMRDGVAHGNRFHLLTSMNLIKYPAHNRFAAVKSGSGTIFEITNDLNGKPVLYEFMEAGDVLEIFMSVNHHLVSIGSGH